MNHLIRNVDNCTFHFFCFEVFHYLNFGNKNMQIVLEKMSAPSYPFATSTLR